MLSYSQCIQSKVKQEEKILNEPAEIYWFNEILFVILSGLKNGLSGL